MAQDQKAAWDAEWRAKHPGEGVRPEGYHGEGGGGGSSAQDLIDSVAKKYQDMLDEYNKKYNDFEKNNPFVFDKVLEDQTKVVTQRLDPYYQQQLGDYLQGVNTTRQRSQQDERTLLSELNADMESYTGANKLNLDKVLQQTRNGAADAGLGFSGASLGAEGEAKQSAGANLSNYLRGATNRASQIQTTADRANTDLTTQANQKTRDLATNEAYDVQSQSLAATLQAQNQREFERAQALGPPPGVNPLQYNINSFGALQ